jgi:hypothetical protein
MEQRHAFYQAIPYSSRFWSEAAFTSLRWVEAYFL